MSTKVTRKEKSRFSLIVASVDRANELGRFLKYLGAQSFLDYEVIIVDQNSDDRIEPVLLQYRERIPITHIHSSIGVSKARNLGINHASGDIIAFPDDDCWYPDNLLELIDEMFNSNPQIDGLIGRVIDENGSDFARFPNKINKVTKMNAYESSCTASIFLRRHVIDSVNYFDEDLGPGTATPWKGGEDTDYILRCVENGFHLQYSPDIIVYHPTKVEHFPKRAYENGIGIGKVWRKHNFPSWYVGYRFFRSLGGTIISLMKLNPNKALFHWNNLQGRWDGWWKSAT